MRLTSPWALAAASLAVASGVVSADPVTWTGNGHSYEAVHVPGGITWQQAYDACVTGSGHLATLTSAEEHAFVYGLVSSRPELWFIDGAGNGEGPWLGGFQPPGSAEPGGGWRWVSDEPWSYTAWSPGEPNDWGGTEHRLIFFQLGGLIGDRWNDAPEALLSNGYVIEFAPPTRECSTWTQNGHTYQIVRTPARVSWTQARDGALARGGYLATLTSSEENAFVAALAMADPTLWYLDPAGNGQGPWLGGYQLPSPSEPAGDWTWVTGEPFGFTAWAPAEPNNLNGNEHWLQFFGKGALTGSQWNDMSETTSYGGLGFVVEYEGGGCVTVGVDDLSKPGLRLLAPRPNPTANETVLQLELPAAATVVADVFALSGRRVRRLTSARYEGGSHPLAWDGKDDQGVEMPAGVYFVRAVVAGRVASQKMVRIW